MNLDKNGFFFGILGAILGSTMSIIISEAVFKTNKVEVAVDAFNSIKTHKVECLNTEEEKTKPKQEKGYPEPVVIVENTEIDHGITVAPPPPEKFMTNKWGEKKPIPKVGDLWRWIYKTDSPFEEDEIHQVEVLEIKEGWVRFKYKRLDEAIYSDRTYEFDDTIKNFIAIYDLYRSK